MKGNRALAWGASAPALFLLIMQMVLVGCSVMNEWRSGAIAAAGWGAPAAAGDSAPESGTAAPSGGLGKTTPEPAKPAEAQQPETELPAGPAAKPAGDKVVALTFDDGPDGKYTPKVLDILKQCDVKATFFLVGVQVEKYPEVAARIVSEGHGIGNHSWSHKDLSKMAVKQLDEQILRAQDAIEKATGSKPDLVRAPYGSISVALMDYLRSKDLKHVYWTVDPRDWAGTSVAEMHETVLEHARPGGIILLHSFGGRKDALDHTLELLPLIIENLKKAGYEFATVDEMIETGQVNASAVK